MATTSKTVIATALASAIATTLFIPPAFAAGMATPDPVAVWDCAVSGGGLDTVQGDDNLSISAGTGANVVNGAIHIASSGIYSGASIVLPSGLTKVSVLVKYSNFAGFSGHTYHSDNDFYAPVFMSVEDSDGNVVGVGATNDATNLSWNWRTANGYHNNVLNRHFAVGPALPAAIGYALFSYDASAGVRISLGTSIASLTTSENGDYHFSGRTLKTVGLGGEHSSSYADGWPNLVIEKVALFTDQFLSGTDIASYCFPSVYTSETYVSDINTRFGEAKEINVELADGARVIGDTTFTATNVNFYGEGEFIITPPAGNEAEFVFKQGTPVIEYSGSLPTSKTAATTFTSNTVPKSFVTDSSAWHGIISLKDMKVTDFTVNVFGNASSSVRLSGISGWLRAPSNSFFENYVPVQLDGELTINNGNSANDSNPNRCTIFKKISGSGKIAMSNAADRVVVVLKDASEFTGDLELLNKFIIFGSSMPTYETISKTSAGTIFVSSGVNVTNSGSWKASGGIIVEGELCATGLDKFDSSTRITTSDAGVFTLTSTGNGSANEAQTDYSRITGTGTLKYEGTGWRAVSTLNFPTNMTVVNEQAGNLILTVPGITYEIGSLSGGGMFEANYVNLSSPRYLRVLQAKDTEWSGLIKSDSQNRFGGLIVASGVSTAGTLTLSGTQIQTASLTVESGAAVNLTGTWKGATAVAGTLGGPGTITGDVTLSDGSTIKVNDISDLLSVSGALTANSGTITVDLPAGTPTDVGTVFLNVEGPITLGALFNVTIDGSPTRLKVFKTAAGLKAAPIPFSIKIR